MTTYSLKMIATFPYSSPVLMALLAGSLVQISHAGISSGESNIISIETRALGVSGETATVTVDTRMTYESWASEASLLPPNDAASAMPHHDGVTNLNKFAFNMDASKPDSHSMTAEGSSGWPIGEVVTQDGNSVLSLISVRRRDSVGLQYKALFSRDSATWIEVTSPIQVTPLSPIWERVRYQVPASEAPSNRWLGKLEVSYTPP